MNSEEVSPEPCEELITVIHAKDQGKQELSSLLIEIIKEAARGEDQVCGHVNVVLTDDAALRELNRRFLGIDENTDVLSFNLGSSDSERIEGDIYISLDRAKAQADDNGIESAREVVNLAVHGFLHLCGYDHDDDVSLRSMIDLGEKFISVISSRNAVGH